MKPVNLIVIGAGNRGSTYASYSKQHPDKLCITGVAEPDEFRRQKMAREYNIPPDNIFTDWKKAVERNKFADGVIISTQDNNHVEPAVSFAGKGYHILLEKPMAPDETGCRRIADSVSGRDIIFAVCHVMRYTDYTTELKNILDSGRIGDIVTIQHLEPVGYWHQAHSYVRGNWRNEKESSFMLLTKSCHDIDWIRYITGRKCKSVSSFGTLKHFRKEQKPVNAGDVCLECEIEAECPYSAKKIYLGRLKRGETGWPVDVLAGDVNRGNIISALKYGPYGRCVYECDNDVVDNQVVNMLFENGSTASFTMTAFTEAGHRKTRIFGTKGEIYGNGSDINIFDFLTDKTETIKTSPADSSILGGHGGGDYVLIKNFVEAVSSNSPDSVLSGHTETLESHLIVFAAEKARKENRVVNLS